MKKLNENLLIAKGEFTRWQRWIVTRANLSSCDRSKTAIGAIALWDTGSMYNFVSNKLAADLGLEKIGMQHVEFGDTLKQRQPVYRCDVTFMESDRTIRMDLIGFDNNGQDVIIGMEAIHRGTFLIEPKSDGGFTFSFYIEPDENEIM